MKQCRDIIPLLDELTDGTLDDVRARAVRTHLRSCASCAEREQQTRALLDAAATLGSVDPPSGLWRGIAAKLDAEDMAASRPTRLWWWWHAWRRAIFAGSGALVAAGLALVVTTARARHPVADTLARALPRAPVSADSIYDEAVREVERAEGDYVRAIDELRALTAQERAHWKPEVARAFDENLAAIDAAIERQAAAARGQTADPIAADALHASYRKKIDFLQEALVRGGVE